MQTCFGGKSSLLNLPKAPLKLGGAAVALMGDGLTNVTDGAVSMLRLGACWKWVIYIDAVLKIGLSIGLRVLRGLAVGTSPWTKSSLIGRIVPRRGSLRHSWLRSSKGADPRSTPRLHSSREEPHGRCEESGRYNALLYCIILYCIVLYCIVLYCIVLYCVVLYCIVLYCIVFYCLI